MKERLLLILLISISIIFSSCSEESSGSYLPAHTGAPGEVVIVMPESQWRGEEGKVIREHLEAYYPQLPQAEPMFSLLQFSEEEMSNILRQHRNIIFVNVGSKVSEETKAVTTQKDKWSSGQLLFTINAADLAKFRNIFAQYAPQITDIINQKEVSRIRSKYQRFNNETATKNIKKKFGIDMVLPDDTELAVNDSGFSWYKRERIKYVNNSPREITQGFFIYKYPYTSDSAFTQASILQVRDSVLKTHVPGPIEGSYMATEYRYPPSSEVAPIGEHYAVLTRGLWRTENYLMGGPFVSLTTLNSEGDSVVCVSGFAFAPQFDKREFVRELEAVLSSVQPAKSSD